MIRGVQERTAALLAALAAFGMVVAPLAHSAQHAREASRTREQALAAVFRLAFNPNRTPEQEQALGDSLDKALGRRPSSKAPHGHSHGSPGKHGAGTLQHLDLALHGPPPPAAVLQPSPLPEARLFAQLSLFFTPRYSTPEHSQAPPAA